MVGGFLVDGDSDDEDEEVNRLPKKRMVDVPSQAAQNIPTIQPLDDLEFLGPPSEKPRESNAQVPPPDLKIRAETDHLQFDSLTSFRSNLTSATRTYKLRACDGETTSIGLRKPNVPVSYESMVSARSKTKEGRAKRAYYGIEIHELMRLAELELKDRQENPPCSTPIPCPEPTPIASQNPSKKSKKAQLWTEKYRARKFTDLCGDDGTNRQVLRWIKKWDPMVFPGTVQQKPKKKFGDQEAEPEKMHKKILLLTGPPGLGKTTLAHVCAKQAGYEVVEINASDDRSRNVVHNRIRTSLGTENVKTVTNSARPGDKPLKPARPVCVIVDEVDGVTTGSGASGEGGFIKALVDLVLVDQKNAASADKTDAAASSKRKKKGDDFRQRRPLILICNDVYHPSLRPLRQSNLAEIIYSGRPSIDAVVGRLTLVFEKEGIPCEKDAARKLCEAAWGMSSGIDNRRGAESTVQGDLRGVMVVGEWVAGKFKAASDKAPKLTRQWVEKHVIQDLGNGGAGARGMGRGGVKDIVTRVFQEGAGFPRQALKMTQDANSLREQPREQLGFSEFHKRSGMAMLQHMVETSGDIDRVMTDIISEYPNHEFNDDCYLSKPNEAYDWLHFMDACSTRLYASQEWELAPYLSQPILACHSLFASPIRAYNTTHENKWGADNEAEAPSQFSGPRASYNAHEAGKHNRNVLQTMQAEFSPTLGRLFRSPEDLATEFVPYLVRMISPAVNPVIVGGGGSKGTSTASVRKDTEKKMVHRAAEVMAEAGIALHKGRLDAEPIPGRGPQFVYRLEP